MQERLLEKPIFSVRQKGVPPLLLPASMLQLPRCLARICNLFQKEQLIANWQVSKSAIAAGKTDCKIQFAPQMWATRPHLGSIFEKLLHRKTFGCLRLVSCNHSSIKKPLYEFLSHSGSSSCYFIQHKFLICPVLPRFHWYPATFLPVHNHPAMFPRSRSMHKHHFLHGSDSVR